jgi:hypothetical protein
MPDTGVCAGPKRAQLQGRNTKLAEAMCVTTPRYGESAEVQGIDVNYRFVTDTCVARVTGSGEFRFDLDGRLQER